MFTGIVEEIGAVERLKTEKNLAVLTIKAPKIARHVVLGESVSVDGVCLTVTKINKNLLSFDMMRETLNATTLGLLKKAANVNLERALALGGRFSGHLVTGHVDGTAKICDIIQLKNYVEFQLTLPQAIKKYIVPKGSICLNGVSLTVGKVSDDKFSIYLIPFTLNATTMALKKKGDAMNIEADILARYILKFKQ